MRNKFVLKIERNVYDYHGLFKDERNSVYYKKNIILNISNCYQISILKHVSTMIYN